MFSRVRPVVPVTNIRSDLTMHIVFGFNDIYAKECTGGLENKLSCLCLNVLILRHNLLFTNIDLFANILSLLIKKILKTRKLMPIQLLTRIPNSSSVLLLLLCHVFSCAMDLGNRKSYLRSAGVKTTGKTKI